jgi:hypothetical protein
LETDVLAALCQQKALSFKNLSCLVRDPIAGVGCRQQIAYRQAKVAAL